MDLPSQKLAEKIISRLTEEGLVSSEAAKKNLQRLADGKLKQEDWRLLVELAGSTGVKP